MIEQPVYCRLCYAVTKDTKEQFFGLQFKATKESIKVEFPP